MRNPLVIAFVAGLLYMYAIVLWLEELEHEESLIPLRAKGNPPEDYTKVSSAEGDAGDHATKSTSGTGKSVSKLRKGSSS